MNCMIHRQSSVASIAIVKPMARLSCIVLLIAMNALMCVAEEHSHTEYEDVDIHDILQNDDLRNEYYNCFMEIAPCKTEHQKRVVEIFSELYQTKCKKCTKRQSELMKILEDWYLKNAPEKWRLVVAKTVEYMKKKNTAGNTE